MYRNQVFGEERLRERKKADPFTFDLMRTSLAWMASLGGGVCVRKDTFSHEVTHKTHAPPTSQHRRYNYLSFLSQSLPLLCH
jgi:hypothetical protein